MENDNQSDEPLFFQARVMSDEEAGGHGERWELFAENAKEIIANWLPTAINNSKVVELGVHDKASNAELIASGEYQAAGLLYSDRKHDENLAGMLLVIAINVQDEPSGDVHNKLVTAYPFFTEGAQIDTVVESIDLFPNRTEAVITLLHGDEMSLHVFDTLFYNHRALYRKGQKARFSIAALAYSMEPADTQTFTIDDPEKIRRHRASEAWAKKYGYWFKEEDEETALAQWEPETPEDLEPIRISTEQMAAYFPSSYGGGNDFSYRGEVTGIKPEAHVLFGMPVWRIDVTVSRLMGDVDFTLPFYVTEKAFAEGWRPKVGEYVAGTAWMQGYMMSTCQNHF